MSNEKLLESFASEIESMVRDYVFADTGDLLFSRQKGQKEAAARARKSGDKHKEAATAFGQEILQRMQRE